MALKTCDYELYHVEQLTILRREKTMKDKIKKTETAEQIEAKIAQLQKEGATIAANYWKRKLDKIK